MHVKLNQFMNRIDTGTLCHIIIMPTRFYVSWNDALRWHQHVEDQRSSGSGEDTTKGRFSTLAGLRFFPSATKTSPLMNLHEEKLFFKITQKFDKEKMSHLIPRWVAMFRIRIRLNSWRFTVFRRTVCNLFMPFLHLSFKINSHWNKNNILKT